MHPFLEHLSIFTLNDLVESEKRSIAFFQDMDLIPSRRNREAPPCPKCHGPMVANTDNALKMGFRWACKKHSSPVNPCKTFLSSLKHTFFDNMKLPFTDTIGLIIGFVMDIPMNEIQKQIIDWRSRRRDKKTHLGIHSVFDYYKRLKSICETIVARNSELQEGKGSKKSYLDCYKLKRLKALPSLGHKVHTILMDIESVYPCPGKKLTTPFAYSLNLESATVTLENDVSLSPSIATKAANSLNNKNVNLLNFIARNSDTSSSNIGSSDILSTLFKDMDSLLEPEVILHANNEGSYSCKIINTSVTSFKDKTVYSLYLGEKQQCKESPVQLSSHQICQEKSDKNVFPYKRIVFHKRIPFIREKLPIEYMSCNSGNSKRKDQNISAVAEKDNFLSSDKEECNTPPVIRKIGQLSENTQFTVSSDHSNSNQDISGEKDLSNEEQCSLQSIISKYVEVPENMQFTVSLEDQCFSNQDVSGEKDILSNEEECSVQSLISENVELPENIQHAEITNQPFVQSKEINSNLSPAAEKRDFVSSSNDKCNVTSVSSKSNELSGNMQSTETSDKCSVNTKNVSHNVSTRKIDILASGKEKHSIPPASSKTAKASKKIQCSKSPDKSSANSKEVGHDESSCAKKNISRTKKKKLSIPSTSSKKVKLSEKEMHAKSLDQSTKISKGLSPSVSSVEKNISTSNKEGNITPSSYLKNAKLSKNIQQHAEGPDKSNSKQTAQNISSIAEKKTISSRKEGKCIVPSDIPKKVQSSAREYPDMFISSTAEIFNEIIVLTDIPETNIRRFHRKYVSMGIPKNFSREGQDFYNQCNRS